ncbi:MAG: hypothetical protein KAG64_05335 [Bacteroidales bacterium]|nr:hypothetical protein [Bacteroidales bacterium]
MGNSDSRAQIIKLLSTKSVVKYEVYDRTMETFKLMKDFTRTFAKDMHKGLSGLERKVPVVFKEKGDFEMEFKVAGDLVLATMHSNVFEFPRHHAVWQNSYVKDDPMRAYSGIISIYNFLADSFKYNRLNDVGYLIGRIFVNKEGHFIVEGKHQLGFMFNDFSEQVINKEYVEKIMEVAIQYSIEFDLLVPPYNQVQTVSVQEMNNITSSISLKTGKRLGFNYKANDSHIE